jgi:hypothetical protein
MAKKFRNFLVFAALSAAAGAAVVYFKKKKEREDFLDEFEDDDDIIAYDASKVDENDLTYNPQEAPVKKESRTYTTLERTAEANSFAPLSETITASVSADGQSQVEEEFFNDNE